MKIKLKNNLPEHIMDMGVKPGEVYDALPLPESRLDALRFRIFRDGKEEWCTVWKAHYEKV